jgi:hypothetical protein
LQRKASDVAARLRETGDEAAADRVRYRHKDDWYDRGRLLSRDNDRGSRRDDDIDLEPDELDYDLGKALASPFRPAILDCDGSVLDPAKFAQPLHERGDPRVHCRRRGRPQEPDGRYFGLLRARR